MLMLPFSSSTFLFFFFFSSFLSLSLTLDPQSPPPTIDWPGCGTIKGVADTEFSVNSFFGIPFASADRFMPPVYNKTCHLDATKYGNICLQIVERSFPTNRTQSEDCLVLDVHVPSSDHPNEKSEPLPVLFWIHGGSSVVGSTDSYANVQRLGGMPTDPQRAVVVAVQYRLGASGFLTLPELTNFNPRATGNMGVMDLQAGLKWVQENIRAFGGDPNRVTLIGQSSGGTLILSLMASRASQGLFSSAISLSASPNITMSLDDAQRLHGIAVEGSGGVCEGVGRGEALLECLQGLSQEELAVALPFPQYDVGFEPPLTTSGPPLSLNGPLCIADGHVVSGPVMSALSSAVIDVPLVLQSTIAEPLFTGANKTIASLSPSQYTSFLKSWLTEHGWESSAGDDLSRLYQDNINVSSTLGWASMIADYSMTCGNMALSLSASKSFVSPVWHTFFARNITGLKTAPDTAPVNFAPHAWDYIMAVGWWNCFHDWFGAPAFTPSREDIEFSNYLRQNWLSIAATGKPSNPGWKRQNDSHPISVIVGDGPSDYSVAEFKQELCSSIADSPIGFDERFWVIN